MRTLIDSALRYAEAGYRVFPVNGKLPLTTHGAHDATTDRDQLQAWWAKWPQANIGMTLEGLVVVDVDPRNGGDVSMLPKLPDTCYAKTGGGGFHYLFKAVEGVRYPGRLAAGIDCKTGAGAYIVVEPSIHASGQAYCWLDESEPWLMAPSLAPHWFASKGRVQPQTQSDSIAEGGRNSHLTSLAGSMRRRGMSQAAIDAALAMENSARCVPPLPEEDVARIAASVSRYQPEEPRQAPALKRASGYAGALESLWKSGLRSGDKTGWATIDELYTVSPGQMTVITGWPNSGKSEWLDALLVNLSKRGWKVAIFSPENMPVELHVAKLMEKLSGKPFADGPSERLTLEEVREYSDEIDQSFAFIENREDGALSAAEVIEAATPFLSEWAESKRGLVIDPWNELEHWRPSNLSETEYISKTLSLIRNWARKQNVHVWLVAHPQKMRREDGKLPIPTPDMISGSANFWNKADCAITVYRNLNEQDTEEVQVHVQKVRFKHIGRRGFAVLLYDRVTGQYRQRPPRSVPQDYKRRASGEEPL